MNQGSNLTYLKRRVAKKRDDEKVKKEYRQIQVLQTKKPLDQQEEEKQDEFQLQQQQQQLNDSMNSLNSSFDEEQELDTNVVSIEFDFLKKIEGIAMGDPTICEKCKAVLNKYSKVLSAEEYLDIQKKESLEKSKVQSKEEQIENDFIMVNQKGLEIAEHENVWRCEFCGHNNVIRIEPEEIPTGEDVVYMVESAQQQIQKKQQNNNNQNQDFSIVFCLDNSGSMSVTSEVKGQKVNLKHGLTKEEYEMLKQFIDQGDEHQMMPGQNKDVSYISRKQCVLGAIEQQLSDMKNENPDRKVGVVTFSDDVVIIGDGHQIEPTVIAGDKLGKAQEIENITIQNTQKLLSHTIKDSIEQITGKFEKLEESGRTALGPALLSAITMAGQGQPGSMVVICTDGLANIGLGQLDIESQESKEFYGMLSQKAKDYGIVISVITIKGEGCKIEVLGQLAEETNGTVTRVDPSDISKDFAAILQDELVGTKVRLEVQLHKALQFRNEDRTFIQDRGSKYEKDIGNATVNTKVTFEYQTKNDEQLQKDSVDIENLKQIPFQARVYYNSVKGDRYLRVLSQLQKATDNKEEAEKEAQVNVLHKRIIQQSANYMQQGRFQNAQKYNSKWSHYVQESSQINSNMSNMQDNVEFNEINRKFKKCANKKVSRNVSSSSSRSIMSNQQQKKKEKGGGFLNSIKNVFKGSSRKQEQEEDFAEDMMIPQQQMKQQQCNKMSLIQEEKVQFSASDDGYSSDEDKDEMNMITFKQAKMKKK